MSDSFDIELMKRKSETKKTMSLLQEDLIYYDDSKYPIISLPVIERSDGHVSVVE